MHTPGPWEVQYGHKSGYPRGVYAPNDAGIAGAVGCVVRFNGIGMPASPTGQANARLIAAAPDMLSALLKAEDQLASFVEPHSPTLAQIRAAIKKATGE